MELQTYELVLGEEGYLDIVSIVTEPAIESDFFAFSKEQKEKQIFEVTDKEKQVITGAAMIPNKKIFRMNESTGEKYNVYFSKETIYACSQSFFINGDPNVTNLEHRVPTQGATVFESWIVDNANGKGGGLNNEDMPDGTWMVSYKINDKLMWDTFIKTGVLNGFSIEGYFDRVSPDDVKLFKVKDIMSNQDISEEEKVKLIKDIL